MKLFIASFFLFLNVNTYTQTVLNSEIKKVKVYQQNAEITREATVELFAGTQEVILNDLSLLADPNSLQVKIASEGKVTLLSAKYETNHLVPKQNNPIIKKLKIDLDILNDELSWIKDQKEIYIGVEDLMNHNKSLSGDAGFTAMQVENLANTYKSKLIEIRKAVSVLKKEEKTKKLKKVNIQNQLKELNAKFNKPSGNIVLLISSISPISASFKFSYIVSSAGWHPIYDLRSGGISKEVNLNYKANVFQQTGHDWKNANLSISTGNPAKNNNRPILTPLYANYYTEAHYKDKYYGRVENKKAVLSNMAYATSAKPVNKPYKEGFQYNANTTENQLNVEFQIAHKQNISSDGKLHIVPLESYQLSTEYVYHSVPKLDKSAFLIAKVSDWAKFNLISGKANIFFEGAYVGESYINAEITSDTMLLSLGRDENISIERKAVKEHTKTNFLGSNKKETYAYGISIKNKKKTAIKLEILDQIPVSQDNTIIIELEEKIGASYTKENGKLLWILDVPTGVSKKVSFKYFIKYPKALTISGAK